MQNATPAFQFYPNDWLSSGRITVMTPAQEGGYIRLLCYDWAQDGIPDDDAILAKLSRLGEEWLKGGSRVVRECFNQHPTKPGFLTSLRLQKERFKQQQWREKSRIGGVNSGITRGSDKSKGGCQMVEPKGNSSSSSSSSISNTPTLADVKAWAALIGMTDDAAVKFWNHFESSGWIDRNRNAIKNPQAKLAAWHADDRARPIENAHKRAEAPAGDSFWKDSKRLEQIEAEIRAIEARASHTATGFRVEEKDRENYKRLKEQRAELKRRLGLK